MKLLTVQDLAELMQMHPVTVRSLCAAGQIPGAKKLGGSWRISDKRFEQWWEEDEPPAERDTLAEPPPRRRTRAIERGKW